MKPIHQHIDKILPFGELMRGFANQQYISKADLKKFMRNRGIFFNNSEKENLVPCISTLLLSPSEFDSLRELQNTKEDNTKKNTSRIEWNSNKTLSEAIRNFNFQNLLPEDGVNFWFSSEPQLSIVDDNQDKILIDFEIERNDLNKSWYESTNIFKGKIELERVSNNEIRITKSYTSSESNLVGDTIQKSLVSHFKKNLFVKEDKELVRILFGDFSNEERITFFYRLSSNMQNSLHFEFKDITNMEFKPDPSISLPIEIDWMNNKSELKLKGNQIHDTFFVREKKYHQNLQFWEMESSFNFTYLNNQGTCNVVFSFKDFLTKGNNAEFEINISNFNLANGTEHTSQEKAQIKNQLLDLFENKKDETYENFKKYLASKDHLVSNN